MARLNAGIASCRCPCWSCANPRLKWASAEPGRISSGASEGTDRAIPVAGAHGLGAFVKRFLKAGALTEQGNGSRQEQQCAKGDECTRSFAVRVRIFPIPKTG